jgi:hypothetical protein
VPVKDNRSFLRAKISRSPQFGEAARPPKKIKGANALRLLRPLSIVPQSF